MSAGHETRRRTSEPRDEFAPLHPHSPALRGAYRGPRGVVGPVVDAAPAQKRPKWSFRPPAPGSQRQSVTGAASGLLTVMGGMAEFERKLIRARCDEGIKRALARGTVFGRKSVLDAGQRRRIAERYAAGETMAALARE